MPIAGKELLKRIQSNIKAFYASFRRIVSSYKNREGRQCTNKPRVDGRSNHGYQPLTNGIVITGGAMHHRGRTYTCFIDVGSTAGTSQCSSQNSTDTGFQAEGRLENGSQHSRQLIKIQTKNNEDKQHIASNHHRHYFSRDNRNAPDATDNDRPYHQANDNTHHKTQTECILYSCRSSKYRSDRLDQLIGLHYTQRTYQPHHRKEISKRFPAFAQPMKNDIHRPPLRFSGRIVSFVHNGKSPFKEFGGHTHNGTYPHPENGSGTSYCNSDSHPRNIPHTHC